jgi:hypothetical protein
LENKKLPKESKRSKFIFYLEIVKITRPQVKQTNTNSSKNMTKLIARKSHAQIKKKNARGELKNRPEGFIVDLKNCKWKDSVGNLNM